MARKKKTITDLHITGIADRGRVVGRTAEGQVVFVDSAAPGDVVDALILRKKKSFLQGKTMHISKYSMHREQPFCEHFDDCGGCKWQHISYAQQLHGKQQVVENVIQKIGGLDKEIVQPILAADYTRYYRNKMEYSFSDTRWLTADEIAEEGDLVRGNALGFHAPGSFDKIVQVDNCHLQADRANLLRNDIWKYAVKHELTFYAAKLHKGLLRNMFIRNTSIEEWMIVMVFGEQDYEAIEAMMEYIKTKHTYLKSIYYIINQKKNDSIYDQDLVLYSGAEYIIEKLNDLQFKISPKSFFQTNTLQGVKLYDVIKKYCDFSGDEVVYDLYTGLGSIALYMADHCKEIIGIEEVQDAITDAKFNKKLNNIDNASFYCGDVKDVLTTDFIAQHPKPDIVITDPPRAGMHKDVVQTLLALEAPKIVYVSCGPATQARDLSILKEKYEVVKCQPVDMFPHTHHVESVALLQLKKEVL
jgi:23S rRNA (uracil1939-C5)-methyltransferase